MLGVLTSLKWFFFAVVIMHLLLVALVLDRVSNFL